MERKQSNLCVSVDVTQAEDALEVVRRVGQSVCMVKVCFDVIPPTPSMRVPGTTHLIIMWLWQLQQIVLDYVSGLDV